MNRACASNEISCCLFPPAYPYQIFVFAHMVISGHHSVFPRLLSAGETSKLGVSRLSSVWPLKVTPSANTVHLG